MKLWVGTQKIPVIELTIIIIWDDDLFLWHGRCAYTAATQLQHVADKGEEYKAGNAGTEVSARPGFPLQTPR